MKTQQTTSHRAARFVGVKTRILLAGILLHLACGPGDTQASTNGLVGDVAQLQRDIAQLKELMSQNAARLVPAGTIIAFGGETNPPGWLLCDGRAVSSSVYPALHDAIMKSWGAGVANTTNDFNLPDLRGMFLRGVSETSARDPDVGERAAANFGGNKGNKVGSIQPEAFKAHHHSYVDATPHGDDNVAKEANNRAKSGSPPYTRLDNFDKGSNDSLWKIEVSRETGESVGSETRPVNAYVRYLIKY